MNTAVQLRQPGSGTPRTELVYGKPHALVTGELGGVAVFSPDQVVAYRIGYRRQTRLFVFRTLEVDDRLAARIPGVRPHVRLLFDVCTTGRARLVRALFAYLARTSRAPAALPDAFYVRIGAALGGRLPAHKILGLLLERALRREERGMTRAPAAQARASSLFGSGIQTVDAGRAHRATDHAPGQSK
jgi:hypothetical protein